MNRLKTACALAFALVVTGCAAPRSELRTVPGWSQTPFDLNGRVLASYDGRAFSSGLRWRHAAQRDEIWLLSPVGQTLAFMTAAADGATLVAADRKQYSAASVESLTREALGWEFPLSRLQYWVQGDAAPDSVPDAVERDASQRFIALTQDGWHIVFANYPPGQHGGLPRRLDLTSGAYEIRLIIDGWRPAPAAP